MIGGHAQMDVRMVAVERALLSQSEKMDKLIAELAGIKAIMEAGR